VGQGHLIGLYTQAFGQLDLTAAQVLLTQEDLADRDRALCLRTTLMRLLELGAVPVLNENDSVSVAELTDFRRGAAAVAAAAEIAGAATRPGPGVTSGFGDNDGLSARVAVSLDADLLVLLTNVGGLYTANPKTDPAAVRISELAGVDDATLGCADGTSEGGTGGMASKLAAAQLASSEGTAVLIAPGAEPRIIERALVGEDVGTLITVGERRPARIRHIAVAARHRGALVVNEGALKALMSEKASLLPIGVVSVEGSFDKGDVVEVRDGSGRVHGRGLVNYPAEACRKLAGRHSDDIDAVLGWRGYDALITRDNLVMGAV
jgi:glutamate 5-kinase